MLSEEINLDELMGEWLSLPTSHQIDNHNNVRLLVETDYSLMETLSGPAMHKNRLKAVIKPKVKGFPDLMMIRKDAWQRYQAFTSDGSAPTFPSLSGHWSSASVCQRHYDKLLQKADLNLERS